MGVLQPLSARCAYPYAARSVAASMEALRLPQIAELSLSSMGSGAVVGSSMHGDHRKRQHSKMNTDTVEDLARLKAIAGERQERDSSNNPQIPEGKVPLNSAASKTSSALADYTKGLQAEDESTDRPRTCRHHCCSSSGCFDRGGFRDVPERGRQARERAKPGPSLAG